MSDGYPLKRTGHYKGPSESEHDLEKVERHAMKHPKKAEIHSREGDTPEGRRSRHGQQQGMFHKEHMEVGFKIKPHSHA